jgi:arylsulfatase A-like enzyme
LCAKPTAPNFVVIYIDDLGWAQTSVPMIEGDPMTRSDYFQTPSLERLAAGGRVLSACYSPAPLCAPSRNSLLHGMTPARMRLTTLSAVEVKKEYRGQITIPNALKQANPNYMTAHFGKWHNECIKPRDAGYDVLDGENNGNGPGDFQDDGKTPLPDDDPKRIFSLTQDTNDFMRKQVKAGKPFYVQLSHYAMHIWHDSLQATRDKYKKLPRPKKGEDKDYVPESEIPVGMFTNGWLINYAAMVEDTDRAFGMTLDVLDDLGIADNTYVIFTSDNGGGFRGNHPLRGSKGNLLEGGIRMPSVVRGPGIEPGSYTTVPMVQWDFLQTFYDLAGGTDPLPADLDGGSLKDVWFNGDDGQVVRNTEEFVFHFPWHTGTPESVIRLGDFKLRKNLDTLEFELYNMSNDLGESNNLADQMPEMVSNLDQRRADYLNQVKAETVTTTRRNYLEQLQGGWIESGEKRLAKLKTDLAADPTNRQLAYQVDVSQNHVNFQASQEEKCLRMIKLHEERGTADSN